ncbi:hypothetical protein SAMN05660909_01415 [Chitinophaga terrae (ex Kim and Jung 2007)]|uniref:DUF2946 domain-containing protein n=1 Tax=Chitinophaga terrae (ex Kim and Jung 2007) TaxID=408074 RepID=A0A1H4A2H3_9BACT|nr:hypothetical protein [Chitinophaga terrae (ex Kim and Jung 2007)]MDQ0106079.1 hypothetical protein [Chitinophaga terrae (ex Kim and Jung 2007)]GEP89997.1 hypothetical protein CTE07_16420 [Chitinophaga terrae (ex Kim and Jung 2007)]SEA29821.1 hypothetical protein SAMN05660909_01415 [Chitinophaga terrae (ex Kim and Jung 2007)]
MRKNLSHIIKLGRQVLAILLLVCFTYATFLPFFHSHTCIEHTENFKDSKSGSITSLCKACSYHIHHQGKDFDLPYPPTLEAPLPAIIEHNGRVCAGIYKMTLNAFTNKGPPAVAA